MTPAQTGSERSSSSSTGGPVLTFAEHSSRGTRTISVAANSCSLGWRASSHRPGMMCSTTQRIARNFCAGSVYFLALAEDDDRAVVHRVVHHRPCEHQAVQKRDANASFAADDSSQHAVAPSSVEIEPARIACVRGGNEERLAVGDECHVADQAFIEDGFDSRSLIVGPVGFAGEALCAGWTELLTLLFTIHQNRGDGAGRCCFPRLPPLKQFSDNVIGDGAWIRRIA